MKHILFLSGLPRSGTKLLRDLLNNHPLISIPRIETVLIPYLTNKFGLDYDLTKPANLQALCDEFEISTFYKNFKLGGKDIKIREKLEGYHKLSWQIFFEEILKFYGPKEYDQSIIIGDKTPGYIAHTDRLLELWPKAKIVHIVRDPRDYAISAQNVWNKNLYRAVDRWNRVMVDLSKKTNLNEQNYKMVLYEQLIETPEKVLSEICTFLDIEFVESMPHLTQPSENFGDAKGQTAILKSNKNKYKQILSDTQILKIERISYHGIIQHGYEFENANIRPETLSQFNLLKYKLLDGLNSLIFHMKEKGPMVGLKYFLQLHKENIK